MTGLEHSCILDDLLNQLEMMSKGQIYIRSATTDYHIPSELVIGTAVAFTALVLASYIGTKLALRSFFGPDYVDPVYKNFTLGNENSENTINQNDR